MKNYINASYSDLRGEVYVFIKDTQLFILHGGQVTNITEDTLTDNDLLRDYVVDEYGDVIADLMAEKDYYGKIVNDADIDHYNNLYKVSLHNYDNEYFYVMADSEDEALEILVGSLADNEETGHLYTLNEIEKDFSEEEIENNFIYIDCSEHTSSEEHIFYLDAEHTNIEQIDF